MGEPADEAAWQVLLQCNPCMPANDFAGMKGEFGDVGRWFDSAALTLGQTADRIVREAHTAVPS
ncbi:hypothetical protein ACIHCV_41115 [Streptomyces sp. NPDC051956]|uniref:hypothetical protein n=1 Tax=Streptomyces sp. NPDC051956 TaxID=3365677 RepID=UPI0037CFE50F